MFDFSYKKMNLKNILMLFILMYCITSIKAQTDVFARIRSNAQEIYVKQPVKVSITVYTATWFTQPLDMGNIQVPNAFVLPFKRTQSAIQYVNKKKYATLEFFYLIFPYQAGELTIPAMDIVAESPPEGDYKGRRIDLKTNPITIKVNPVPRVADDQNWMVATNATITERWNRPLTDLKVGELIERTITIRASGTLPAFIPPLHIEQPNWAGIYPREPELKDTRTNTSANGILIQRYRYLLEKEGTFEVDPVSISWWNPHLQKKYSRETKATTLTIIPNPDLGILATMRDSLSISQSVDNLAEEDKELTIFGLSIYQFSILVILIIILTFLIIQLLKRVIINVRYRKAAYINSERYYFHQLLKALGNDQQDTLNALYLWLLSLNQEAYTLESIKAKLSNATINQQLNELLLNIFDNQPAQTQQYLSKHDIEHLREELKIKLKNPTEKLPILNP